MARDYSKPGPSGHHKKNKTSRFKLVFLSFLVGYLAASLIHLEGIGSWLEKQKTIYFQQPASQAPKKAKPIQKAELPKPKFEFYTLLTKENQSTSSVKTSAQVKEARPSSVKSATSPVAKVEEAHAPLKPTSKYLIQVASFRNMKDAERLKASLTLKGFDVSINENDQGSNHWYRVVIGPYSDLIKAEKAQTVIARNERVMGIILKQNA